MSEQQEEYIVDALEMIGVSEPRKIVTEVSGFIPVFEVVLHHYKDYMTALVFGRMWQYCNMSDGVCRASLERIGNDLKISSATVMRHAEKLVNDGFLIDTTPDRRNAPHEYLDGRRVEMKGRISAGIAERKPTVSQRNATVSESQLIKQDNTKIKPSKKGDLVDGLLFFGKQAKEQNVDGIENLLQEIERGLHVNIKRTPANQAAARRILEDGRPFGQWLTWCISDEWRAARLYLYADVDKIWEVWPQGFAKSDNTNPQGLQVGF